jgi:hypothetical protein
LTGEPRPGAKPNGHNWKHHAPALAGAADDAEEMRRALKIWNEAGEIDRTIAWDYLIRPRWQGGRGLLIPTGLSGRGKCASSWG